MPKFFNLLLKYFVIWTIAITFWSLMRQFGQESVEEPNIEGFWHHALVNLTLGFTSGLILSFFDYLLKSFINRFTNFGIKVGISSFINLILFILIICIGIIIFNYLQNIETKWSQIIAFLKSKENVLLLFYCYLVSFITNFVTQIDRKFGPGNLFKMLIGEFQTPKEVERAFLFLDLNSSTSIAENIGHNKYSQLIQDCFQEVKLIEEFKGEIYQYVGDEVVISWKRENAIKNNNCIQAFFAFQDKLLSKEDYFKAKYGVFPSFKGGMNFGKIMMAEVGEIKREIAYHGDTINVASRIQGKCQEFGQSLLISESINDLIINDHLFKIEFITDIKLKGKEKHIKIYSVNK